MVAHSIDFPDEQIWRQIDFKSAQATRKCHSWSERHTVAVD